METILKKWKLTAQKYKRDAYKIQEQLLEILITLPQEQIINLNLGRAQVHAVDMTYLRFFYGQN